MKRYVLLILAILLFMILRISWINTKLKRGLDEMQWQIDSLEVELKLEAGSWKLEEGKQKMEKMMLDSINMQFKATDSAIFSHGQQIRWLQWHVERLNKLK